MAGRFSFSRLLSALAKMAAEDATDEKGKPGQQQQAHQREIENSILVLAAAVIRCDKNYTGDTEKHIRNFLSAQFGGGGLGQRLKSIDNHLDTGTEPFVKIACKELKMLTTHDSRLTILNFLFGVADADDFINAKELRCIARIAGYLGISDKDFKQTRAAFTGRNNPFKILGITETASITEVKAAHRKMVLKYHPDKRGEGLTEEEATAKFREVQRAFEAIKKLMQK